MPVAELFLASIKNAFRGNIEWKTGSVKIRAALMRESFGDLLNLGGAYSGQDNFEFWSDCQPTSYLSLATNNVVMNLDLTSEGISQVDAPQPGGIVKFDAPDLTFSNLTSGASGSTSIRFLALYMQGDSDETSPLIGYFHFDSNIELSGQDLKIIWDADGIINATFRHD